jgi:formamidopyrimidine-DNA glycosylase
MPELPEVEFCRRALLRWTAGRQITAATVVDPRSIRLKRTSRPTDAHPSGRQALLEVVLGAPPGELLRHGKRLLWCFGERALLLHLGMAGKWTRRPTKFPKLRLHLGVDEIVFSDPRLLGGVVPTTVAEGRKLLTDGLGPDALREPLPVLTGKRAVKVALMDQSVVAGLGNLHAAEALWRARIDPRTRAEQVRGKQRRDLQAAVTAQLEAEIAAFDKEDEIVYVEDAGADNPFPVYGREGAECPRCRGVIARMVQAGRSTYWCPDCQR